MQNIENPKLVSLSENEIQFIADYFNTYIEAEYNAGRDEYHAWTRDIVLTKNDIAELPESASLTLGLNLSCDGEYIEGDSIDYADTDWAEPDDAFDISEESLTKILDKVGYILDPGEFRDPNEGIYNPCDFYPC